MKGARLVNFSGKVLCGEIKLNITVNCWYQIVAEAKLRL